MSEPENPSPATSAEPSRWLRELHERFLDLRDGTVAQYIPALAKVDPDVFGLASCSVKGELASAGDADRRFSIQSACKPFLYALALTRLGRESVHRRVGVEPSGDAFHSVLRVESRTHRPHNPMINAGAIVVASLLGERGPSEDANRLLELLGAFANRFDLHVDEEIHRSESETGDRNRALAYLMHHLSMLDEPVEDTIDLYFRMCSVRVDVRDLAIMAAVFAAAGRHPMSGERIVSREVVRDVLAVLSTCGMYDGTGAFAVEVGMPAKSSVSGAIVVVAPGEFGLAVHSPRLDAKGNSVRGLAVLREVARREKLHLFGPLPSRFDVRPPPTRDELHRNLEAARVAVADVVEGTRAPYLPVGGRDGEPFAMAICTVDGEVVVVGDAEEPFTIQAAANPFTYAFASREHGASFVHARVGVEPSGNPFHAIEFARHARRPFNPLGNPGAIAIAGMQPGVDAEQRWRRLWKELSTLAGTDELTFDEEVYAAERRHGSRNRAIAYLLRSFGIIEDVPATLDLYFRQCSLQVDVVRLARMGAVLAACGKDPETGRFLLPPEVVQRVLTVMYTCGMHDASGQFAFEVGLPGKSGISGGILAVAPGRMGIAAYSPRVDARGASVRGFEALRVLSTSLGLGVFATRSLAPPDGSPERME